MFSQGLFDDADQIVVRLLRVGHVVVLSGPRAGDRLDTGTAAFCPLVAETTLRS